MSASPYHFIIVEDDKDMRNLIRRVILRQYPAARISESPDGRDALELFHAGGADLVVVDHRLPLLNGPSLVKSLRARSGTVPIIMVSSSPLAKEEALSAGANCFIDKAELIPNMIETLATLLPG